MALTLASCRRRTRRAHGCAARRLPHLVRRKPALGQDVEHFPANIAGRADHCDLVTHRSLSGQKATGPLLRLTGTCVLLCENRYQDNVGPCLRDVDAVAKARHGHSPHASIWRLQPSPTRSDRHAGAPVRLCGGFGVVCHPRPCGTRPAANLARRRSGAEAGLGRGRPLASELRPQSARIRQKKQPLTLS